MESLRRGDGECGAREGATARAFRVATVVNHVRRAPCLFIYLRAILTEFIYPSRLFSCEGFALSTPARPPGRSSTSPNLPAAPLARPRFAILSKSTRLPETATRCNSRCVPPLPLVTTRDARTLRSTEEGRPLSSLPRTYTALSGCSNSSRGSLPSPRQPKRRRGVATQRRLPSPRRRTQATKSTSWWCPPMSLEPRADSECECGAELPRGTPERALVGLVLAADDADAEEAVARVDAGRTGGGRGGGSAGSSAISSRVWSGGVNATVVSRSRRFQPSCALW